MAYNYGDISDRSWGFGHTTAASQTVTSSIAANGTITTIAVTTGDSTSGPATPPAREEFADPAGDGALRDRSWGFGQSLVLSNQVRANYGPGYTLVAATDNGATAPVYSGSTVHPTPSQDFSSIVDRASGWGHASGGGNNVLINGVSTAFPAAHD